jgi:hypothetical protein
MDLTGHRRAKPVLRTGTDPAWSRKALALAGLRVPVVRLEPETFQRGRIAAKAKEGEDWTSPSRIAGQDRPATEEGAPARTARAGAIAALALTFAPGCA